MSTIPSNQHPCERIYQLGASGARFGEMPGTCRITGKEAVGMPFGKWVRDTFTDHAWLKPGNIISNEAAFCFEEKSEIIQRLTGRDKPQCFRTYSHVVCDGNWYLFTKADKARVAALLMERDPEIVCLSDSGQKHLLFKNRPGMWQLEDMQLMPDTKLFTYLHTRFMQLLGMGFSQAEVISGQYAAYKALKVDRATWRSLEADIAQHRGKQVFKFTAWLMYSVKEG